MRRLANLCLSVGATVAVLGVIGVALGYRPSALPAVVLGVAAYKLVFMAASGLVAAGAMLGCAARRENQGRKTMDAAAPAVQNLHSGVPSDGDTASLGPT